MVIDKFKELAASYGAVWKEKNTIIEEWPYALKLRHGERGAQEEFNRRLVLGAETSKERYVEWQRAPDATAGVRQEEASKKIAETSPKQTSDKAAEAASDTAPQAVPQTAP